MFLNLCLRLTFHDLDQLNIHNPRIRANLAGALARLNPNGHDSVNGQSHSVDPGILSRLFGLGE